MKTYKKKYSDEFCCVVETRQDEFKYTILAGFHQGKNSIDFTHLARLIDIFSEKQPISYSEDIFVLMPTEDNPINGKIIDVKEFDNDWDVYDDHKLPKSWENILNTKEVDEWYLGETVPLTFYEFWVSYFQDKSVK